MAYYDENGNKIDGRKFNRGHVGKSGRKPKSYETKLAEKLSDVEDDVIAKIKEKALQGDKDMIKLYMAYLHGQPKVKTENETDVNVNTEFRVTDILNFGGTQLGIPPNTDNDFFFEEEE
jgi:hypothetical protein